MSVRAGGKPAGDLVGSRLLRRAVIGRNWKCRAVSLGCAEAQKTPKASSQDHAYRGAETMTDRRKLELLIVIIGTVALTVGGVAIRLLYTAAIDQQRARVMETAQSQARLIETGQGGPGDA